MGFIKEFKTFAMQGSVVDLAIGVVIGAAFGKIVDSLVNDILMPVLGILTGGYDLTKLSFKVGSAELKYGNFMQVSLSFIIIAFVLFLIIKLINKLKAEEPVKPE